MRILSTNLGRREPNPVATRPDTGHGKRPVDVLQVFDPGERGAGERLSGVAGDFVGDHLHHGGTHKAVYAVGREELDRWEQVLGHAIEPGWFGENLTVAGGDLSEQVVGTVWRVGSAQLRVSVPRIPCATFQGVTGRRGWIKEFTAAGGAGTYLAVVAAGQVHPGDDVDLLHVPEHGVTIRQVFQARTTRAELAAEVLRAGDDLAPDVTEKLQQRVRG